jgi:hypothetical protein
MSVRFIERNGEGLPTLAAETADYLYLLIRLEHDQLKLPRVHWPALAGCSGPAIVALPIGELKLRNLLVSELPPRMVVRR